MNRLLALLPTAAGFALLIALPAAAAERDICENRSGAELLRCIEASARQTPEGAARLPAKTTAPVETTPEPSSRNVLSPLPEDCTGRIGAELRRCLAAGGRLAPSAAVVGRNLAAPTGVPDSDACEGTTGDDRRACIAPSARRTTTTKRAGAQPQTLACTGYTAADQPLCVHRNAAIVECRDRQKYPDYDVCLRSLMNRAPDPGPADCAKLQGRARAHCEARNRSFQSCVADKLGYFACLDHRLGSDAVLPRR